MSVEEKESLVLLRSLVSSGCRAWPSCGRVGSPGVALLPERGVRLLKGRVRVNPPSPIISPTDREFSPQSTAQWFVLPVICRIAWVRVLGLMLSKGYHLNGKVVRIPMVFGVFVMTIFQKLG